MSCRVGHRCGSDLVLLWLWHRLAAAAVIRPLAWELAYAMNMALKKEKEEEKRKQIKISNKQFSLPSEGRKRTNEVSRKKEITDIRVEKQKKKTKQNKNHNNNKKPNQPTNQPNKKQFKSH